MKALSERSCFGAIVENRQEQTSWLGQLGAAVPDQAQAQAGLDAVAASLYAEGWNIIEDVREPSENPEYGRYFAYRKDGINIRATYLLGRTATVEVLATTTCVDHPSDHQMLRSALDPGYGKSSKYYPDGR